jgi:hypothetical protein
VAFEAIPIASQYWSISQCHLAPSLTPVAGPLARQQGALANIPPKRNRKDPICLSPLLYRARNMTERSFNKSCNVGVSQPDMPSWQPTIWRSSNGHQLCANESALGDSVISLRLDILPEIVN